MMSEREAAASPDVGDGSQQSLEEASHDSKPSADTISREPPPGIPVYPEPVDDPKHLLRGDHFLYRISKTGFSPQYRSALVIEVQPLSCTVILIENEPKGVKQKTLHFRELKNLHLIQYAFPRYSREEAIRRAEKRLDWDEKRYHPLINNSHFFVTWAVTGKEYSLDDLLWKITNGDDTAVDEPVPLAPVLTKVPVRSLTDVKPGDHLMKPGGCLMKHVKHDDHLLVESVDLDNHKYTAYTCVTHQLTPEVTKEKVEKWPPVHVVWWKKVVKKECTWEEGTDTFRIDYDENTKLLLSEETLQRAKACVEKEPHRKKIGLEKKPQYDSAQKWAGSDEFVTMMKTGLEKEPQHDSACSSAQKWAGSDEFVTMMKTGMKYSIDQRCLFSENIEPISCTPLSPTINAAAFPSEADHIVVKDRVGTYRSFLVLQCITQSSVIVKPDIDGTKECAELDLLQYSEVYRINYKECLPVAATLARATSKVGTEMLQSYKNEPDLFVSWAKTGKQMSADTSKLREKLQVAHIRPLFRERLYSVDEIQVGDHIIQSYPTHWFHCMVTECDVDPGDPRKFTAIYCLRTSICEEEVTLDPTDDDIYRIVYAESLPAHVAIKRARTHLRSHKLHPLARMWFVRWAKTGSDEGMEVELLPNSAMPSTKSRINTFAQLNPGDYLVEDNKYPTLPKHHYLVVEIHSPTTCTIIESWRKLIIHRTITFQEANTYHRLNYADSACVRLEQAIATASDMMGKSAKRRRFVNFVKTRDASEVDVDNLMDDRFLLRREKVQAASDLQPGDHVERPVKCLQGIAYHHMLVAEKSAHQRRCKVLHFDVSNEKKNGSVTESEEDLFTEGERVFRIFYPERVAAEKSLRVLRELCGEKGYHLRDNNCEHVVTKATVDEKHPFSIQVDEFKHKLLEFSKKSILSPTAMAIADMAIRNGVKTATSEVAKVGVRAAFTTAALKTTATEATNAAVKTGMNAAMAGVVGGTAAGVNVVIEAPLLTRSIYKLHRQKKFGRISEAEFKRGIIRKSFASANTVIGGTAGAVLGQIVIPVPILGAVVGGGLGTVAGRAIGWCEGYAISFIIRPDKEVNLPIVVTFQFTDDEFK